MQLLRVSLSLFIVSVVALVGCQREDAIHEEIVTHENREPIHLRVAIRKSDKLVWIFRLSGPEAQVKEHSADFEKFVREAKFEGDHDAVLSEPKTWKKDPPGAMRYAGYRLNAKPKELEVTVSRFPRDTFKFLENIHRWQRQLNEPLAESEADARAFAKTETLADKDTVEWIDLKGLAAHTVSKVPDARTQKQKKFISPIQAKKGGRTPFTYEAPKSWGRKGQGGIALDVFEVTDGKERAEVTITVLPGDAGGLAANINRWRTQIKLQEVNDAQIRADAVVLPLEGIKNHYVDLRNPNNKTGPSRILGAILENEDERWFIKMTGPHDWVGQNKADFERFVKSFRLEAK